jgi:3-hydroxyacyl-CoA dehydrogenase
MRQALFFQLLPQGFSCKPGNLFATNMVTPCIAQDQKRYLIERYYPQQFLRRKVKAGRIGRKTGKGWYRYEDDGTKRG